MAAPDPQSPLLRQSEAADHLRLSQRTLERWRVSGTGPAFVKLGRRVLYRKLDLEEWIASRVLHSTSEAAISDL
jgi:excisionase family DNA binding protein